jgi:hypothetical protein
VSQAQNSAIAVLLQLLPQLLFLPSPLLKLFGMPLVIPVASLPKHEHTNVPHCCCCSVLSEGPSSLLLVVAIPAMAFMCSRAHRGLTSILLMMT